MTIVCPPAHVLQGNERQILKGVDGYVEPNHMCAIMGPSGCGKTTLLDTLAGRLASSASAAGEIRVNGHRTALSYGKAAYVTQEDVLIGTLTVFETILYSAKLRLPQARSSRRLCRRCPAPPCTSGSLQCNHGRRPRLPAASHPAFSLRSSRRH